MKDTIKKFTNLLLERVFGLKLYSIRAHGREDTLDISNSEIEVKMIFDVGANIGQSASKFINEFPNSKIHSFEPVSNTFQALQKRFGENSNLTIVKTALGEENGTMEIFVPRHSTMASLVKPKEFLESEKVTIKTIDTYCQENDISQIDLLKIDAEGYDLKVLKGATSMLQNHAIKLILVELGFDPKDPNHVDFESVKSYLENYGFNVFGIYDQQLEWSGEKKLRYANVCFINPNTTSQ